MKRTLLAPFLLSAALLAQAPSPPVDDIKAADLRAHIGFLASDELQGREAGTVWNDIAGCYVAREFDRLGLTRVCEDGKSWFQPFRNSGKNLRNVLGLVPGTDPKLKDEIVVVGAHYDHVGLGRFGSTGGITPEDTIHNGADDNASGTAGMLELAEHFSRTPGKRSLLFLAFTAEELGLLGSKAYVDDPVLPLENTVAMINLDMIGRSENRYLFIGGTGTSSIWNQLLDAHIKPAGFDLETGKGGEAPSDNTNFFLKGIPVLFFFTNIHDDYHRPSDHIDKIHFEDEVKIVRAIAPLVRELADRAERPDFVKAGGMAMPKDFMQRMGKLMAQQARAPRKPKAAERPASQPAAAPAKKPAEPERPRKLGVSLDGGNGKPITITAVQAGGAAEEVGLKPGDQLLAINGNPIASYAELGKAAAARTEDQPLRLKVRRGSEELEFEIR